MPIAVPSRTHPVSVPVSVSVPELQRQRTANRNQQSVPSGSDPVKPRIEICRCPLFLSLFGNLCRCR